MPNAWLTHDLSSSGVIGDPSQANGAQGEALQQRLVQGWSALFGSLLGSDWPPREPKAELGQR